MVLFKQCIEEGIISGSWKEAKVLIIAKSEECPTLVESHRPTYLLNIDDKILVMIMAEILQPVIVEIVHPDQVGIC